VNDRLQLRKHVRVGLGRVRVTTHGELDDGQSDGPDIGRYGVRADLTGTFSLDTLGL
jgi:hypothetical protein